MSGADWLEVAGAVWTIVRVLAPWVIDHAPGLFGSA